MTLRALDKVKGYKTYLFSAGLAVVGVVYLCASGVSTWESPEAGVTAAVRHTLGVVALMLAGVSASLRHAISDLHKWRKLG